jgi:hypothetical protein
VLAATSIAGCSATGIDASKDRPSGADGVSKIVVGAGPCCLVATDDGIWVMNHRDKTVQLVDPDRNKPGESISVNPYNKWISAGDKMLMEGESGAAIFDPATNKVRPIAGVSTVRGLAFDPKTGDTLDSYAIPLSDNTDLATYYAMGGVVIGFGSIWTTIFDDTYADDAVVRLER